MQKNYKKVYLDACSSAPIEDKTLDYMNEVQKVAWGNPSSLHSEGIKAAEILERSRLSISNDLNAQPSEIIFTSGATESVHIGLIGVGISLTPGRIVISSVEHPAVISAANNLVNYGWELFYWPVDNLGRLKMDLLDKILEPPTKIVSVVWGQPEIGTLQPIKIIGDACKDRGIVFHTDATQVLSQSKIDWNNLPCDLLSASSHKLRGPKGVGILLRKQDSTIDLKSILGGGGQEFGLRSGTQPVTLIAGMAKALHNIQGSFDINSSLDLIDNQAIFILTHQLKRSLANLKGCFFTGDPERRLPHHISLCVSTSNGYPLPGREIVRQLSYFGISASSGTACSNGIPSDSKVLAAINIEQRWCRSGLRLSLGPWLNKDDLIEVPSILEKAISITARIVNNA